MGCEARELKGSPQPVVAVVELALDVAPIQTPPVRVSALDLQATLYQNLSHAPAADLGQAYRNMVSAAAARIATAGSKGVKNAA